MERYNYKKVVKQDIKDVIMNEEKYQNIITENLDEAYDMLYDELWDVDEITGNLTGSYTLNEWQAEENLCHNMDLLVEACESFGDSLDRMLKEGAETCDVSIRCYLLSEMLQEVLNEMTT